MDKKDDYLKGPGGCGRAEGYVRMDDLTDMKGLLMDALFTIREAGKIGENSACDYVEEVSNELLDVEDTLSLLIGKCIANYRKIGSILNEADNDNKTKGAN